MKTLLCRFAFLTALTFSGAALAVDTTPTTGSPDLSAPRASIKAKDFKAAVVQLTGMVNAGVQHPDLYSLLGFSLRKSGDPKTALTYYRKALDFDPAHKGALEYQGELYVETGEIAKAKANLVALEKLCPTGCEEREDLEKALSAAVKSN
ncbi:Flp pilus assembly protein TadD [Bosea sp. BE271]|jgi:Flp pilus assembly protein TadD|uniref:tetratricopeptide repeat protein n=1 Tax=Bosea TaxID=85413 RepID=UPI0028635009|nr:MULTISPECIES: tetratricopeptide repeat protein [Bosea]MDR6830764.1 Flp pilus assembly protein TadD [Bosea robiniae]MDR6895421.1 Flp pilus assembly protein TadD [Bosea sp. BE109]MDR7138817.1 Flp pilus assembly protein TadD [Bosea sp. BE168]MDR7175518.1 Flp pilus assembly protein TadD [Bosea sp. BE271]